LTNVTITFIIIIVVIFLIIVTLVILSRSAGVIIVQTPLRLSFLGGGTDFENFYLTHDGAVLSTAINKYIFIIIKKGFDDRIYLNYSQKEVVNSADDLKHDLVRESIRMVGVTKRVEVTTLADIPAEGTGLGSSSCVTVGVLHGLYTYRGVIVPAEVLAEQACRIEIDILGRPIGRQDQFIVAYGGMRFITFSKSGINIEKIELTPEDKLRLNNSLLLFYTGITRNASDILAEQKANINHRLEVLSELEKLAYQARQAVIEGKFDELGELMHRGWEYKKSLAGKINNSHIDEIYKRAIKAGAVGGKITGAGGGGFLLLYCPKEKQGEVCRALVGLRQLPFQFEADGSKVIFNTGGED
jgi:D-glycero-alpha-D-manno-heptose-7-phosphate kinase